jgi:sugar phosphate isomerase/epimerase
MALGPTDAVFCTVPVAHLPLFDLLAPVRAAGFAGISIAVSHLLELETAGVSITEVHRRIADAGLQVAEVDCIGIWLPQQAAGSSPYAEVLRTLTPERVVGYAAALKARSVSVVELFGVPVEVEPAAERFAAICDMAGEAGLLAAIEFLPAGGIPDLTTAAAIVQAADRWNGGLMVDAFHLFRSGSTLAELATLPPRQIVGVQLCDAGAEPDGPLAEEMVARRLHPGEGALDVAGMVRTLREIGSQAPWGVEVFNAAAFTQPVEETARTWFAAARRVAPGIQA